jgi:Coenzyme PQQ synthesis protein D (PqqD)
MMKLLKIGQKPQREKYMLQRNASILWRELDGEAVLLSPSAGCSYNLNQVGTFIWKMLDGKHTSHDIATAICQVFEVEYEQVLQDMENILVELRNNDLLTESTTPYAVV